MKPTIFLTSRVHCGETVASYFLQGMLDLLSSDSATSRALLENFVFKIVPVLNPDGVARGYWRTDCNSVNLNRMYAGPDLELYPTIYHVKRIIEQEHLQ